jgi:regulator of sigma E protease
MEILIAILAVIFVLGVAINIHEFGHFIVAKLFGMRIDAYSFFGLGPRIWGFKVGHTDYRISAIPLGAYVKLYGDDATGPLEGKDEQAEVVPESELYELRPRWQKFLVMIGGPFMNILLALAIPFTLAMMNGVPATPAPIVGYVKAGGAAEKAGIKPGDRIVAFDGVENPTWDRVRNDALISPEKQIPVVVERGGQPIPLTISPTRFSEGGNTVGFLDLEPEGGVEPVVVELVQPGMPASESGLQKGDLITSFNGAPVKNQTEVRQKIIDNGANPITLTVSRNDETKEISVTPTVAEGQTAKIGVGFGNQYAKARESVGVVGAAAYAWNANMEILRLTAKAFGQVSTGERSAGETFAGPIGIVQIISQIANNASFIDLLGLLGLISLNLGIFNLLPIPMLDGGQIMVLAIEGFLALFGVTLSMRIKEKIQLAGLAAILLLMVFTIFNDVSKFFR